MSPDNWPVLRAIWRGTKGFAAALMLGWAGLVVAGVSTGIATIFCYGLGMYVGGPAGFGIGVYLSFRVPKSDAAFVFGLGTSSWILASWAVGPVPETGPDFWFFIIAPSIGAASYLLLYLVRNLVPFPVRRVLGGALCALLGLFWFGRFLQVIYR